MTDLIWHALVMALIASIPVRMTTRRVLVILSIPALGEIAQFFIPSRTPEWIDFQVGICAAGAVLCLRKLYRDIAPVVRRYRERRKRYDL